VVRRLQAVFERQEREDRPRLERALTGRGILAVLPELARESETMPGLVLLDATMQAEAIREDHPAHEFTRRRIDQLNADIRRELERERGLGRLRADLDLDLTTRQLSAMARGLQIQWLYDPSVDMAAHLEAYLAFLRA